MKNLHVIPTDKPSRLWINTINGELVLDKEANELHAQNIYITSDEKLPYDSSIFNSGAFYHRDPVGDVHIITKHTFKPNPHFCKRIILTTDQDLIKDSVQAIDDDFLEWFVKNPSCEKVDVLNEPYKLPYESGNIYQNHWFDNYKIIIPKEEPKQKTTIYGTIRYEERVYSEEDMKLSFEAGKKGYMRGSMLHQEYYFTWKNFKQWLEQFKKK
jgi:hypothetical protein